MANNRKGLFLHGGVGAGTGAAASWATGAKAVGLLGGICTGAPALPVFIAVGALGGVFVFAFRMTRKGRRW